MTDFLETDLRDSNLLQELKTKSLKGIRELIKRQVLIRLIYLAANIILARLLAPQIFGVFAIVSFVVQFFSTFGDVGIGAALIQKKGELSQIELSTTFWLQQFLVWVVVGLVQIGAPLVTHIYPSLPQTGVWLIRAMALSFLLTSLKTIPAILMERKLDFNRIAWVDIAESLVFHITTVSLAFSGFGVWSFIIAAILRSIVGVIMIYSISIWRPALHFHFGSVKGLVRFGLPYQGNTILSFIKDAVTPLFVGTYAGAAAVGYVNWARNLAFAPLMLSETFSRVAFPAFSKIQNDRELLAKTIERSIRCMTLIMFPLTALMLALGPAIVHVVFTDKWLPGIKAYYFYCTSPLVIGVLLPMYSAILAVGKSDILLKMTGALLVLEWGMGIPFVIHFGFSGIAFSQPIIALFFYFVYKHVLLGERIIVATTTNIKWPLVGAVIAGIVCKMLFLCFQPTLFTLSFMFCMGIVLYLSVIYTFNKNGFYELKNYLFKIVGREQREYAYTAN